MEKWYFQSTGPNRGLQGMLWARACCALSWVLIITVLFVLAITFGRRFGFLRLKITTTAVFEWYEGELWALHCFSVWEPMLPLKSHVIHITWRTCYEHQTFINLSGLELPSCKDAAATLMNSSLSINAHFFVTWMIKPGCGLNFLFYVLALS